MAQNSPHAFHVAQSTDPGAACLFLANLDNNLTDDELWGRISGENVRLGLECEILVTRKRNLGGDMRPSAHMQFKREKDAETALAHLNGLRIGARKIRAAYGSGHIILGARIDDERPSPRTAAETLVGQPNQAWMRRVRSDLDGSNYAILDDRPGMIFEFRTVEVRRIIWQRFRAEAEGLQGKYVVKDGYKFRRP